MTNPLLIPEAHHKCGCLILITRNANAPPIFKIITCSKHTVNVNDLIIQIHRDNAQRPTVKQWKKLTEAQLILEIAHPGLRVYPQTFDTYLRAWKYVVRNMIPDATDEECTQWHNLISKE